MPRLPTADSVGRQDPRATYRAPTYPMDDPVAAANARVGASMAQLGNTGVAIIAKQYEDTKKERDLLEWSRADADVQSQVAKLNEARDAETDPDKLAGYEAAHRQIVDDAAKRLGDPSKAALWRTKQDVDITRQGIVAGGRAKKLRTDRELAEDDQRLEGMGLNAERAGSYEDLEGVVGGANDIINRQEKSGLIDARRAGEARRRVYDNMLTRWIKSKPLAEQLQILGSEDDPPPAPGGARNLTTMQKALLAGINYGEAPNGRYDVRYTPDGGAKFALNGEHPNVPEVIRSGPNAGKTSTAAGRYQFLKSTWDLVPDSVIGADRKFTEENQDKAALWLAERDYRDRTGGDLWSDLRREGMSTRIQKVLGPTWEAMDKGGWDKRAQVFSAALGQGGGDQPEATVQKASVGGGGASAPTPIAIPKLMPDSQERFDEAVKAQPNRPMDQLLGAKDWDTFAPFFSRPDGTALTAKEAAAKIAGSASARTATPAATDPAAADASRVAAEGGPRRVLSGGSPLLPGGQEAPASTSTQGGAKGDEPAKPTGVPADGASAATGAGSMAGGAAAVASEATPKTRAQVAIQQLPWDMRNKLRSELRTKIGQAERDNEKRTKVEQVDVAGQVRDDLASIGRTGEGMPNLTEDRVRTVLGPEAAVAWREERGRQRQTWEALDGIEMLTEGEIEQRLQRLEPKAGTVGYVENVKAYDDARKRAGKIVEARRTDPAGAVDDFPPVRQARLEAKYISEGNQRRIDPASAQRIVQARLDAQERLGIVEPSAVTRSQGLRIAADLRRYENDDVKLGSFVKGLHEQYGDLADEVLISSIQQAKVNRDLAAESVEHLNRITRGERTRQDQARKLDTLRDDQTASDALAGRPPAPVPALPSYDSWGGWGEPEVREAPSPPTASPPNAATKSAPAKPDAEPTLGGSVKGADLELLWKNRDNPEFIRDFNETFKSDTDQQPAQKLLKIIEKRHPAAKQAAR